MGNIRSECNLTEAITVRPMALGGMKSEVFYK